MNIVVLTADEPLYLTEFFAPLLASRSAQVRAIFLVPPLYSKDSHWTMLRRYRRAFGWWNLLVLAQRVAAVKLRERFAGGSGGARSHSLRRLARHYGVPCAGIGDVNAPEFLARLRELGTDLIVSVSCPQIFRRPLIALPRRGCLNVHGAILPAYRGIAPSFWMMANGERQAGVTVFLVNEDIDAGDVVVQETFPILPDETLEQFIVRSRALHAEALLRAIAIVENGPVQAWPLSREGSSYYGYPTREAYQEFRRRGRRLW
jgi:methionyl-tRNA formyltransferase